MRSRSALAALLSSSAAAWLVGFVPAFGAPMSPVVLPTASPVASPTPTAVPSPSASPSPTPAPEATPEPTPSVTPLSAPPAPPPDAAGISPTTAPIGTPAALPTPVLPSVLWLADGDSTTVDIEVHDAHPFVPVVVDGVRREFLVSTLEPTSIDDTVKADGAASAPTVSTLQIGDIRLTGVAVSRTRVAPYSQAYLGHEADGIIGSDLLSRFPITIDYKASTMTIYRTEAAAVAARPASALALRMEMVGDQPAVDCAIDDAQTSPCFVDVDSDADLMLYWNYDEARKRLPLGTTLTCMREAEPGREVFGRISRTRSLELGSVTIAGPIVRFPSPTEMEPSANPREWRTRIGGGVFQRFAVTIDELGGTLVLSGATPDVTQSAFDRSGLWLVVHDGAVVVRNVLSGSPGAKAGVVEGDSIVSVDGIPATDLDSVRDHLMGAAGTQVALVFDHGKRQADATLTLRDLL